MGDDITDFRKISKGKMGGARAPPHSQRAVYFSCYVTQRRARPYYVISRALAVSTHAYGV